MMQHLLNDLVGHGGDVGTGQGTVGHVDGVAHAGRDDLGLDVGVVEEHVVDGLDELDAPLGDIVQAPQEGADVGGTGAGGQQRLVGAENQGAVGGDALGGQGFDGLEALGGHGDFYDHVLGVQGVDGLALLDHRLGIGGGGFHLTADGAVHDGGNFSQRLGVVPALLGDEAGVGGDTGTPAMTPMSLAARISLTFAVSMKNFIQLHSLFSL